MSIKAITIIEPQIAAITAGALSSLWRLGATMQGLHVGDLLWVREPFYLAKRFSHLAPTVAMQRGAEPLFATDCTADMPLADDWLGGRRYARTLPRAWHRQHLRVLGVDRRRLHTITDEEVRAQGYEHRHHFANAWDANVMFQRHAAKWQDNPLATVITFTRIEGVVPCG